MNRFNIYKLELMKHSIILFCLIILMSELSAQDLYLFNQNGKYGYCNKEKEIIIACQFDHAEEFDKNFAIVENNQLSGIINKEGVFVVPPKYYYIDFRSQYFEDSIVNEVYTLEQNNGDHRLQTYIGKDNLFIKKKYEEVYLEDDGSIHFFRNSKSKIGKRYFNGKYRLVKAHKINNGESCTCGLGYFEFDMQLADVMRIDSNNRVGFRNKTESPAFFKDTLMQYKRREKKGYHKQAIFLKYTNIPVIYDSILRLSQLQYLVKKEKKYGIVNAVNENLIPIEYDSIILRNGNYNGYKVYQEGKAGIISLNDKGETKNIILPFYENLLPTNFLNYYIAIKDSLKGLIDAKNNILIPFQFTSIILNNNCIGMATVKTVDNKMGIYDILSKKLLFDDGSLNYSTFLSNYDNGKLLYQFYLLKAKGVYKIFFPTTKKVLELPEIDSILEIHKEVNEIVFMYKQNSKWGLIKIDIQNEIFQKLDALYDEIYRNRNLKAIEKHLYPVKLISKNIQFGYVDSDGNEYFP